MKLNILAITLLIGLVSCTVKINDLNRRHKRSAYLYAGKWVNGTIPYLLDPKTGFTTTEKTAVLNGIATIMNATKNCVKFIQRTTQKDYLIITGIETGCWSYLGKRGGAQTTSLNRVKCLGPLAILHELTHVIGMIHEHQRPDRDKFVKILWNNVHPNNYDDYYTYSKYEADTLNFPYDYNSIVHYKSYSHNVNASLPTIIPLDSKIDPTTLGTKTGLSPIDIAKMKKYFGCPP